MKVQVIRNRVKTKRIDRSDGTLALIMTPTRELAFQIYQVMQTLLHPFNWIVPGYLTCLEVL